MTRLSVNINKVATLRNARGEDTPNVEKFAYDCELFGAQGITVHPRPDERHITRRDVDMLSKQVSTEFNIEGNPTEDFIGLVLRAKPAQVTLVPDSPDALTSSAGWNVLAHREFLSDVVSRFKKAGIRVSIFVDADPQQVKAAAEVGADRVELYTKPYADMFPIDPERAVTPFVEAAKQAQLSGLGLNAGHDLSRKNLKFFKQRIPNLDEVSIGHALISDALYLGIKETIRQYLAQLSV